MVFVLPALQHNRSVAIIQLQRIADYHSLVFGCVILGILAAQSDVCDMRKVECINLVGEFLAH